MKTEQDINPIEFIENYLGIELLPYQKEILRKMWSTDKIFIYQGLNIIGVEKYVINGTDQSD